MTALNPKIIKDTIKLIDLYKNNPTFRERFDTALKRNVNATYHYRPLKLYFEVLASVNSPKYKEVYHQVHSLVRSDNEGIIGKTFMNVSQKDITDLNQAAKKAEENINSTAYPEREIEKINQAEQIKDTAERKKAHQKRLESSKHLTEEEKQETEKKPEEIIPGESLEHKKSYNPASQEEMDRLKTALLPKEEASKNVLISPSGQALTKPLKALEEAPIGTLVGPSGEPIRNIQPETHREPGGPSLPSMPNIPRSSGFKQFFSSPRTYVSNIFRGGAGAGKVAAAGAGKVIGKVGAKTAVKAGIGVAAKLGISALAGLSTMGVGFIVGLAVSFPKETIKLFKLILWIVIGLIAFIGFMFFAQRGTKMNSLLPPYEVPTPTVTTRPTPTPPKGIIGVCPTQAFIDQNRKTTPETCQYLNPPINIFGDLTTAQINAYISKYWQQSGLSESQFTDKTNLIIERSRASGLNPVIFLGYWKSESAFKEGFGCQNTSLDFNSQLECAVGLTAGASRVMQCASPKSPYREQGCRDIKSIIMAHPDIYDKSLFNFDFSKTSFSLADEPNPIRTFDAIAEGHGPRSPSLSQLEGVTNNNCIHTYNDLLEVILTTNACTQPTPTLTPTPTPPLAPFNSYFCQSDPFWASLPISNSGDTMASGGCGLTSIAMILNYFGLPYTPKDILTKFNDNPSWYTYTDGTNINLALDWVKSLGFEVVELNPDVTALERDIPRYLDSGYLILGSQYINNPLSHIFVVSKSLPNGNVILQDPDKFCQPNLEKTITGIMNDYSNPTYGQWMYAKAIKKVR